MAEHGEIVFETGQNDENNSDIWDDTALIKAYDKAINSVRIQINKGKTDDDTEGNNSTEMPPKKHEKKGKQRKKKRKSSFKQKWKVGDQCCTVFTDDNLLYNATIKSLNYKRGTCWVTYIGYGNEEEKYLDDLLPPTQDAMSQEEESYISENGYESVDMDTWSNPRQSPLHPEPGSRYPPSWQSSRVYPPAGPNPWYFPPQPPSWGSAQYPIPVPSSFEHRLSHAPGYGRGPRVLPQPPPPPPTEGDGDHEALHAMLMAWYMSGYHTGYYQGMKNAKKRNASSSLSER